MTVQKYRGIYEGQKYRLKKQSAKCVIELTGFYNCKCSRKLEKIVPKSIFCNLARYALEIL